MERARGLGITVFDNSVCMALDNSNNRGYRGKKAVQADILCHLNLRRVENH